MLQQILQGDCLDILDGVKDESVDALITDPPFFIGKIYDGKKEPDGSPQDYWRWLKPRYDKAVSKVKSGGFIAVWSNYKYFPHFWQWFGDDIRIYIAAKNFTQLRRTPINFGYDPVIVKYKSGAKPLAPSKPKRNIDFFVANTAAAVSKPNALARQFPYPRPLDACMEIISNFTIDGGTILDPFCGSGTIGVASAKLGRSYLGIEVNKEYIDLAKKRLTMLE